MRKGFKLWMKKKKREGEMLGMEILAVFFSEKSEWRDCGDRREFINVPRVGERIR